MAFGNRWLQPPFNPAQAFQFMLAKSRPLDTTLTAGASWRMDDRDTDQLGKMNLGLADRLVRGCCFGQLG